jgi:DNA repair protein RadC
VLTRKELCQLRVPRTGEEHAQCNRDRIVFLSHESLRVILLNTKQELIKVVSISQGTLNEALAHPREVFKPVIAFSAYSFLMVHKHPSGANRPLSQIPTVFFDD